MEGKDDPKWLVKSCDNPLAMLFKSRNIPGCAQMLCKSGSAIKITHFLKLLLYNSKMKVPRA